MKSEKLFKRAKQVLVGGVNSPVRAFKSVGGTPRFVRHAGGARFTDEEGREYIDYCQSWGPLIFGHGRKEIGLAAQKAIKAGTTYGAATMAEVRMAEALREAIPSMQLIRLTSSGTEAVMSALRVARAFTKRDKVIKFAGCYHGHVDSLLVAAGSGATTLGIPDSAGVPKAWAQTTITLPYNDSAALKAAFKRWGREIAAVIVEPIVGNMGVVGPRVDFLQNLRKATAKNGSLLIFDEVITGFRLCYGGAQNIFGIKPDLTTLGKIVGGGFPMAAYGGRREIMEMIAPLGPVYQAGTLSGNPVAVAAGLACLKLLKEEKPYKRLTELADYLIMGLSEQAAKHNVPLQMHSAGSMFTPFFCGTPIYDYATAKKADSKRYAKYFNLMLKQGVYLPPAQFEAAFVSFAHKAAELDATIAAAGKAFRAL